VVGDRAVEVTALDAADSKTSDSDESSRPLKQQTTSASASTPAPAPAPASTAAPTYIPVPPAAAAASAPASTPTPASTPATSAATSSTAAAPAAAASTASNHTAASTTSSGSGSGSTALVPASAPAEDVHLIKLRGLPWNSTEQDVRHFMQSVRLHEPAPSDAHDSKTSLLPTPIWIVKNEIGRDTGEAFVRVKSSEDLAAARKLHRQLMGRRFIEIFVVGVPELEDTKRRYGHLSSASASSHSSAHSSAAGAAAAVSGSSGIGAPLSGDAHPPAQGSSSADGSQFLVPPLHSRHYAPPFF
jgi:hypothetical protein